MELDEKINKINKTQPDISALVEEIFALSRDFNAPHVNLSPLCRETRDRTTKAKKIFIEDTNKRHRD